MTHAILTERLTKYYGSRCVVNCLDLRVPAGTVYGFLGRNGAGKSTTIKMLLGMAQPSYGRVELLGHEIGVLPSLVRGRIAYLAEGHPLYTWMTVAEAVRFCRSFHAGPVLTSLLGWVPGMKGQLVEVPFVGDNFVTMYVFIGAALAVTLGFRQSAWEPSQGTALYLLHLPLGRHTIFATKLMTGIGELLVCTLLPILVYATWAAMPGTHPGPFEWSMTGPAFRIWLLMPLVYLGAFASGIRPARWFGSRLLPLVIGRNSSHRVVCSSALVADRFPTAR